MAAIPDNAVERLRRLEQRVDGWRTLYADLQAQFMDARAEAGRLENLLQRAGEGRRLEVDERGVFYREPRGFGGVRRTVGLGTTPHPGDRPPQVLRHLAEPPGGAARQ